MIDGKSRKVSKIPYHSRSLTIRELNYTLNDAVQNEFDRSVVVMAGLGEIGGLRHSEIVGLTVGKVRHDELMNISDEIWEMSGYDKDFYKSHDEYMMIDTAIMDNKVKFPKGGIVRVVANPDPLKMILDYAMEQRMEVLDIVGRELLCSDNVYLPLINVIKNQPLNSQKLSRKWSEYQKRRKADNVVVALYVLLFLVLAVFQIGAHTGYGEIFPAAIQRGNAVVLTENKPPVFIKVGFMENSSCSKVRYCSAAL